MTKRRRRQLLLTSTAYCHWWGSQHFRRLAERRWARIEFGQMELKMIRRQHARQIKAINAAWASRISPVKARVIVFDPIQELGSEMIHIAIEEWLPFDLKTTRYRVSRQQMFHIERLEDAFDLAQRVADSWREEIIPSLAELLMKKMGRKH